jgi:hypothetical protein
MKETVVRFVFLLFLILVSGVFLANGQATPPQPLTYFIPQPDASHVNPATSIAVRQGSPLHPSAAALSIFEVTGEQSGPHSGRTALSDDGLTLLFYPDDPFAYGETVHVTVGPGLTTAHGAAIASTSYQFTIIDRPISAFPPVQSEEFAAISESTPHAPSGGDPPYLTHPEFTGVMTTTVTLFSRETAEGLIFVAPMGLAFQGQRGLMILDDRGELIYFQPTSPDLFVTDFKMQTVAGSDFLTYHLGPAGDLVAGGVNVVLDENYQFVDTWTMGNGYGTDEHEFLLLDNGNAIVMSYTPIPYNLEPYGGPSNGTLIDVVLQELDSSKNVVFEWHAIDHIPVGDTIQTLTTTSPIDYFHTNSIEVDHDGHWLISSRHTSEVTKINRQSGDVIWRMGGRGNQFIFSNDLGISLQHDARRLDNGHILVFDNGNFHDPPRSRAIEYEVNVTTMKVTRTWLYPEGVNEFGAFMGSARRLPNGNTIIGWGDIPKLTEVQADGTVALEMLLGTRTYRVFRSDWHGMPLEPPRAILQYESSPSAVTIYTSWNGATGIEEYDIYAGPTRDTMSVVATVPRTSFEETIALSGVAANNCFFQVQPIHAEGAIMPRSGMMIRPDLANCQAVLFNSYFPRLHQ